MDSKQPKWQIVEKDDYGTDWAAVRYEDRAIARFDTKTAAEEETRNYLTKNNCINALTKDEKLNNFEMFFIDDKGVYLGELDGEPWYLTHPKDVMGKVDGEMTVKYTKGAIVQDRQADHRLETKTEVKVRTIPGT